MFSKINIYLLNLTINVVQIALHTGWIVSTILKKTKQNQHIVIHVE